MINVASALSGAIKGHEVRRNRIYVTFGGRDGKWGYGPKNSRADMPTDEYICDILTLSLAIFGAAEDTVQRYQPRMPLVVSAAEPS